MKKNLTQSAKDAKRDYLLALFASFALCVRFFCLYE